MNELQVSPAIVKTCGWEATVLGPGMIDQSWDEIVLDLIDLILRKVGNRIRSGDPNLKVADQST